MTDGVIGWLLDGDPAVRWQVERDLLDAPEATWRGTQAKVTAEGWGRRLLDHQDLEGTWAAGLYSPKWTSTTYTLLQLRRLGLPPTNAAAVRGAQRLLDAARWVDGGVSYWQSHRYAERCVNGMVLSITSWFDVADDRMDDIAALLLRAQMEDGGWNCEDHRGATHASFHTTISVLEGLTLWQRRRASSVAAAALEGGHEFMLRHGLFRSHRTGDVIDPAWLAFSFPPRWHYDVLRGLDHLQGVAASPDERAAEAVEVVRVARRDDGTWGVGRRYSGKRWFTMEDGRRPGRWNTLRALRVLQWWEGAEEAAS